MKDFLSYLLLIVFCTANSRDTCAQRINESNQSRRYSSELLTDLNFSTSSINSIAQDQMGFMWFGTWNGLFMYDGYQVRSYKPRPGFQDCFKGRKIRVIFKDSKGRLWIGSSLSGLHLFDESRQCFRQFSFSDAKNSIPENDVMAIWEDSKANIWIATTYGFVSKLVFDDTGEVLFENYKFDREGVDFLSTSVSEDILWLGTTQGLLRFDLNNPGTKGGKGNFSVVETTDAFTNSAIINAVCVDTEANNTIWIGTIRGIRRLNFAEKGSVDTQTFFINPDQPGDIKNRIKRIYQSDSHPGILWIGTDEGAFQLKKEGGEASPLAILNPGQPIDDKINDFYEDASGVAWIGTNKGVRKINKYRKEFNHIAISKEQIEASGEIRGIINHNDEIYLATHGFGVMKLNNDKNDLAFERVIFDQENSGANFINSVGADAENHLWAGTDGTGLYRISIDKDQLRPSTVIHYLKGDRGLSDNYIYSMLSDSRQIFWVGTYQGGVNRYDPASDRFIVYDKVNGISEKLSDYPVIKIIEDDAGNIWIGSRGNGIYIFKPDNKDNPGEEKFKKLGAEDGLLDNFITDIYEDGNSKIWIGTETGLSMYDPESETFRSFSRSNGFPVDIVQSIQGFDNHELWISTVKGILRMNTEMTESEPVNQRTYREYNFSDGLGNNYFNSNVAMEMNGLLYFGGLNGLTYFDPDAIDINPHKPEIALTDFELNHQSVPVGEFNGRTILPDDINNLEEIVLKHSDNVLTFEFSALHFASPDKNNYAYMMEGFDKDWIFTNANRRYAHYTNLSHGEYVFKVIASNNDGVWNEEGKVLKVTVLPPFWLTPLAFVLYTLVVIGILLLIRKITLIRANLKHKIQLERLEREKSDELHNLELQYFTNISHEIRTPLTLILSPLEKMLKEEDLNARLSNQLNLMHHHGVRLFRLLNQLLDFRKHGRGKTMIKAAEGDFIKFIREIYISFRESAIERDISFSFNNPLDRCNLYFDRDILEKVMYNLLSNAFKYTGDNGAIDINISLQSSDNIRDYIKRDFSEYNEIFEQQYLTIQVKDNGPGIAAEDLKRIFERFYQVKSQSATSSIGTGIGLSLTKELVLLHKGVVSVSSDKTIGTVFSVHLPLGRTHLSDEEIIDNFKDSESRIHYKPFIKKEKAFDKAQKQDVNGSDKAKLLIVEDNEDVRNFILSILSDEYDLVEAASGKEGLEKAVGEIPDLIISDIMMPEVDGLELCSQIKKDERTSHIPVILLTARTGLIFKVEGIETGADDYITKPFSPEYLEARVRNLIDQRKILKKRFSEKLYVKPKDITLNSLDEIFLNKTIELVNENMSNSEYGIDDMCLDLGMSRMQLYRKLKALTGQSANEFIRTQRLQRAAQLLEQQQLTIAQVTYEVGFNDLKYFRNRFSEHFGMTPSEYVNQHRKVSEQNL